MDAFNGVRSFCCCSSFAAEIIANSLTHSRLTAIAIARNTLDIQHSHVYHTQHVTTRQKKKNNSSENTTIWFTYEFRKFVCFSVHFGHLPMLRMPAIHWCWSTIWPFVKHIRFSSRIYKVRHSLVCAHNQSMPVALYNVHTPAASRTDVSQQITQ